MAYKPTPEFDVLYSLSKSSVPMSPLKLNPTSNQTRMPSLEVTTVDMEWIWSDRLMLRTAKETDAWDLYEIWRRRDVVGWQTHAPLSTFTFAKDQLTAFLTPSLITQWCVILLLGDLERRVIGMLAWWDGELQLDIHPNYWGNGYATEALTAILNEHYWKEEGYGRLKCKVAVGNQRARKVLRKCGFREVKGAREVKWVEEMGKVTFAEMEIKRAWVARWRALPGSFWLKAVIIGAVLLVLWLRLRT